MKFVGCKVYGYKALKSILILLCLFCFSVLHFNQKS